MKKSNRGLLKDEYVNFTAEKLTELCYKGICPMKRGCPFGSSPICPFPVEEVEHSEDVPALLAEVERLRADVARLEDEVSSLEQELKFSDETEYALIRKLFDLKVCHKEAICEQADAPELKFEGEDGCLFCWRQWAIRKAREAESEGESK